MKLPDIKLHKADDLADACSLLEKYGNRSRALAGGTDLVVDLKSKRVVCEHLISLENVKGLDQITLERGKIRIGALALLSTVADSPVLKKHLPALSDAAVAMATPQVRNMGTIGGNVAMAVPSADLPPALISANAQIVTESVFENRMLPIREFFTGPRKTVLKQNELIREIVIEVPSENSGISYQKFQLRGSAALAVAGIAASLTVKDGVIADACITLGAVAPTPVIAKRACKYLVGKPPTEEVLTEAGKIACDEGNPISDVRGSKEFRCVLIGVLTKRALTEALERIKAKTIPAKKRGRK